ncbi:POT family proton-dependent oligopeptide transporter [Acinetobacter calcoaceticus]|uniref:POT family proton-dependent oligopeptide transporter n=1 Tax=Acinetobacter calcoaceticus TaxID=471 RepID=A0A4R1XTJ0_ACICA|nr:POT family proton-dependent oligopeptide transporter [Acinetobacter calcoaceticus]
MSIKTKQQDQAFFGHPQPLKGLFFTELWERFSYYGIRPLLILYMSAIVVDGGLGLDRASAAALVGVFAGSIYLMTVFGGWIADNWLGQNKSVWYGSILIALGHLSIALNAFLDQFFFYFGLVLIVLGSGLFKTCIAVIVGGLYHSNDGRRDAGFSLFYMGINMGSFFAPLITGVLVQQYGWHIGFGVGGIGMLISLLVFRFYTLPQLQRFDQQRAADAQIVTSNFDRPVVKNPHAVKIVIGFLALLGVVISLVSVGMIQINMVFLATYLTIAVCLCIGLYFIYLMFFAALNQQERFQVLMCFVLLITAALFWSAFEQKPTSFNLFARDYTDRMLFGYEIPTLWFQSINALFIVLFAPIAAWIWIKLAKSNKEPTHITKFIIALLLAASGFLMMGFASQSIVSGQGGLVSPLWLVFSILLLTLGELCLSPVGLSAMTKLAPSMLRGQIMGLWCAASALGNLMAGLIGGHMVSVEIETLPSLFFKCVLALVIGAVILLLLKPVIQRMMLKSQSEELPQK